MSTLVDSKPRNQRFIRTASDNISDVSDIHKSEAPMLLNTPQSGHLNSSRESIHNYYEAMVFEQLVPSSDRAAADPEFMADAACVALNRLPPRYVRHDVDMTFFLSPTEMEEMLIKVAHAVNDAVSYVEEREKLREQEEDE